MIQYDISQDDIWPSHPTMTSLIAARVCWRFVWRLCSFPRHAGSYDPALLLLARVISWFRQIGYPDGSNKPSGYPICPNHEITWASNNNNNKNNKNNNKNNKKNNNNKNNNTNINNNNNNNNNNKYNNNDDSTTTSTRSAIAHAATIAIAVAPPVTNTISK